MSTLQIKVRPMGVLVFSISVESQRRQNLLQMDLIPKLSEMSWKILETE